MFSIRDVPRSLLSIAVIVLLEWTALTYATDTGSVREAYQGSVRRTSILYSGTPQLIRDRSQLATQHLMDSTAYEIPMLMQEYKMLVLMRRLVKMTDRRSIRGYETPLEVMEVCQDFSPAEQRRLFKYTVAGGVASGLSTITNAGLGQMGIQEFRWNTEKVLLNKSFGPELSARLFRTMDEYGLEFRFQQWRVSYRKREYSTKSREMYTFWFSNKFGIYYAQIGDRKLIAPLWKFPLGKLRWSYDLTRERLVTSMRLRKSDRMHVRAVHVFSGEQRNHHFRGEIYFFW